MSCNLFSDLGGTNIRSQRWTKSSLRTTATAYQKHWEPSKKAEITWLDARWHPTFLERQGLICLVPIKKQFVLVRDFLRGERFNNQIQKSWWKVFRSLELESFIIWNRTSQIISKKHENSVLHARRLLHWFKTTKSWKSWKPTIHNIISNWISARQQTLGKQTEMSCNLFSDLGGTNIRSQRWTKSSLWATATAYQKHWEPSKKAEIGWFSRKATPNFSWEARFDMTCSHQKTVLSCQGLSPWREIQ